MTSHRFPVFTRDGVTRVAEGYECEALGDPGDHGAGVVMVRLGTTALHMAPADAFVFADLILTAVAVADVEFAKRLLTRDEDERSGGHATLWDRCAGYATSSTVSPSGTRTPVALRCTLDRDHDAPHKYKHED